ncbi:Hypothetical protein PHPALM_10273 [Phytophthora palmivora]|uniref:Uncharacterized protein n=1 Tax=Phytophthora palmivora TaxID=4796 RepID=A0A2P4Y558_9STRA|nr:Hypothetical protein PHPALM_10273 [Phytophthora palmivora]
MNRIRRYRGEEIFTNDREAKRQVDGVVLKYYDGCDKIRFPVSMSFSLVF